MTNPSSCDSCGRPHGMWATDRLTLLLDRWGWDEQAPSIIADRGPVALLVVDLDNFKRVNDRFGHVAGDEVLKAVADTLRRTTRKGDLLGRYGGQGGDEFLVLLPETGPADAHAVAERIRVGVRSMVVQAPTSNGTKTITAITASVGVAAGSPGMDVQSLVVAADNALREAKRGGRDKVRASGAEPGKWRTVPLRLAVLGACAVSISFIPVMSATPKPVEQSAAAETAVPAPTTASSLPTVTVPTTVTATTTVPPRTVVVAAPKPKKTPTSEQPAARSIETPPPTSTRSLCPMCDFVNGLIPSFMPRGPR